jgi:hypothetical protein
MDKDPGTIASGQRLLKTLFRVKARVLKDIEHKAVSVDGYREEIRVMITSAPSGIARCLQSMLWLFNGDAAPVSAFLGEEARHRALEYAEVPVQQICEEVILPTFQRAAELWSLGVFRGTAAKRFTDNRPLYILAGLMCALGLNYGSRYAAHVFFALRALLSLPLYMLFRCLENFCVLILAFCAPRFLSSFDSSVFLFLV